MITDDVNDQFSQYPGEAPERNKKKSIALTVFVAWLFFCGIWAVLYIPKIKEAVKETEFIEIITNLDEYSEIPDSTTKVLYFIDIDEEPVKVYSKITFTGASEYHDAIEGLLKGPDNGALSKATVTCIPRGTVLKGLSVEGKWAFADFSSDFLNYEDSWTENWFELAQRQILLTIHELNSEVTELILLIDGSEYSQYSLEK